ncbi:helix-turn-helix domain-containing protein [Desulfovibrio cuneatus]|uniref:helix-turn-helix domain-containing protein n=1 Tax=Desulfovibrio cuneatus TaxID=159728 RepID=UPI0004217019|nr:helix-turn-helix transcriptional regulator [Desulfovibrio cuneatus]
MEKDKLIRSVGAAIARQRLHAEMTQAQVAEALEIEKETVSRIETGAISPTITRLAQFAELFGCPVNAFFWQEQGKADDQTITILEMISSLPENKRALIVRFIGEITKVLE